MSRFKLAKLCLFAIFVLIMKRLLVISYWIASILLVVICLSSLGYRFIEALFIGTMFLPGALATKYFFPKVSFKNKRSGIKETIFVVLGILIGEILLLIVAHFCILSFRGNLPGSVNDWPDLPHILSNPVFIAIILTSLATGCHFFESWLNKKHPDQSGTISFTSDRKHVTLTKDDIIYIESNDDATTIVASGGRRFKNYTPISQWEAILAPHFIRIHRSFLVNKSAITRIDVDILYIGDIQLPISRKYKDAVTNNL